MSKALPPSWKDMINEEAANQENLWGFDPKGEGGKVGRNHPETSKLAARRVKSGSQKAQILALLRLAPYGRTGYSLSKQVVNGAGSSISSNQTCTRLQELREEGLVERCFDDITGIPMTEVTTPGNTGHLHWLTDRGRNVAATLITSASTDWLGDDDESNN